MYFGGSTNIQYFITMTILIIMYFIHLYDWEHGAVRTAQDCEVEESLGNLRRGQKVDGGCP